MMNYYRAAALIVEMVSDLRIAGYDRAEYHEAAALACKELLRDYEEGDKRNEPEAGEAASLERAH